MPNGYTPIAFVQVDSGNTYIDLESFWISSNNSVNARVRNSGNSDKNAQLTVTVVCAKSALVS